MVCWDVSVELGFGVCVLLGLCKHVGLWSVSVEVRFWCVLFVECFS